MAIPKEKYAEIAKTDRITITVIFDSLSIRERLEAILYMLDNETSFEGVLKSFLKDDNEIYLRAIHEANKMPESKGNDEKLLDIAYDIYLRKTT